MNGRSESCSLVAQWPSLLLRQHRRPPVVAMSAPERTAEPAATEDETQKNKSSFLVCGTRFDIDRKYKLIKPIGHGAYGVVWYQRVYFCMLTRNQIKNSTQNAK